MKNLINHKRAIMGADSIESLIAAVETMSDDGGFSYTDTSSLRSNARRAEQQMKLGVAECLRLAARRELSL